ncbi:MAG TPA: hypothetical protein VG965_05495 [Patescibacteria group bacterium]|nr:hypothetical protein [Patescibacteria group bacterium]
MTEQSIGEQLEKERSLGRAYHWTSENKIDQIRQGGDYVVFDENGKQGVNEPGLLPLRNLFDLWSFTFCFLGSPYPEEWQKHPDIFRALLKRFGDNPQLISFEVREEDDPRVLELGHSIPYFNGLGFDTSSDRNVFWKYTGSMTPLKDYKGGFELPELVVTKHIPLSRLTFLDGSEIVKAVRSV